MAIVIPSKNIYEVQNPKIIDNIIDNVKVDTTVVNESNEYNVSVLNLRVNDISYVSKTEVYNISGATRLIPGSNVSYEVGAYIKIVPYISTLTITIPKLLTNKYIKELILGTDKAGNYNLSISITYETQQSLSTASFSYDTISGEAKIKDFIYGETEYGTETKTFAPFTEQDLTTTYIDELNNTISTSVFNSFNNTYSQEAYGILGNKNFKETNDYFSFDISFLSGYEKLTYSGESTLNYGEWWQIQGILQKYIPKQFVITVYGNTIGIDLTDGSVTSGIGTKPHSLGGNEIMQKSNTYGIGENSAIEYLSNNILNKYKKGKETATILCDINEYYYYDTLTQSSSNYKLKSTKNTQIDLGQTDEDISVGVSEILGNKFAKIRHKPLDFGYYVEIGYTLDGLGFQTQTVYIFPNTRETTYALGSSTSQIHYIYIIKSYVIGSMKFEIGDEVIPMVFGADGKDRPMSRKADGSAKVFKVLGNRIFYDGAVWQQISLQEI